MLAKRNRGNLENRKTYRIDILAYTIWTWQEKFKKNNQFLSEKRAEK